MPLLAVGTFNTPELFTIDFSPEKHTLRLVHTSTAIGNHSWLTTSSFDGPAIHLYATHAGKSRPPLPPTESSATETASRSSYVTVTNTQAQHPVFYTVGGPTGEVIALDTETGGFDLEGKLHPSTISSSGSTAGRVQEFDFVSGQCSVLGKTLLDSQTSNNASHANGDLDKHDGKNNMDFGGLRHGSHGVDLSPDGTACFVPDIGRNCIWVYAVNQQYGSLRLTQKREADRSNDGPRHTTCHPNGRYVYCLQEHSSYVDVYQLEEGPRLVWKQGVRIIPQGESEGDYWADEVRVSVEGYLFASTRGLKKGTKEWVAVFKLDEQGLVKGEALCM